MQVTSFPVHEVALSTPEDEDVISGEERPVGTVMFAWGLRGPERLLTPIARFVAQDIEPDAMIALGTELVAEGERLKGLETEGPAGDGEPRSPNPSPQPGPPARVQPITDPHVVQQVATASLSA